MMTEKQTTDIKATDNTRQIRPALYLIPSTMSDAPVSDVIPDGNITIIRGIRHFVVENVRTVRRFLKRCDRNIDIDTLSFTVLDEHTRPEEIPAMLSPIAEGHPVGVISEAGCPAIADPGADLVAIAQTKGYETIPLVGPSSIILSLMGSGFNGQSFAFVGYLPHESKARTARLRELEQRIRREGQTQIFIETPYRNNRLIAELASTLPPGLKLCVASDITGPQQSIVTLPLSKWAKRKYDYDKIPTIFLLNS
jgi:16S rRNA (cytidine1402-2'-O)-methyltransferase